MVRVDKSEVGGKKRNNLRDYVSSALVFQTRGQDVVVRVGEEDPFLLDQGPKRLGRIFRGPQNRVRLEMFA